MKRKRKRNKKNKNYFARFFDGDLSLPHSYWIVGTLIGIGVGFSVAFISIMLGLPDRAISVLLLPWLIFVSIGVCRSSENYKGSKFWMILARITIVLSMINIVVSILMGI